jgi:hypothetical protein
MHPDREPMVSICPGAGTAGRGLTGLNAFEQALMLSHRSKGAECTPPFADAAFTHQLAETRLRVVSSHRKEAERQVVASPTSDAGLLIVHRGTYRCSYDLSSHLRLLFE